MVEASMSDATVCIDVISSVLNGARFLPEFLESVRLQTHADWRLWIRNDGSTDDSAAIVAAAARLDSRIRLIDDGGPPLGIAQTYAAVLDRLPADSRYVMIGDVDDVWMPDKMTRTLRFMKRLETEEAPGTPLLVHSDLTVVDEHLHVIAPSLWAYRGVDPEPATLRRLVVLNPVTAPGVMLNAPLTRALAGGMPREALFQDWWFALVAAALGRVVAMRESTVLYRQHGSNAIGAGRTGPGRGLVRDIVGGVRRRSLFRANLVKSTRQAGALLERYRAELSDTDREFLSAYSALPSERFFRRRLALWRYRVLPEHGTVERLGILLRG
jgi:hypothetical protein